MRTFIPLFLLAAAYWHTMGGGSIDLGEATLAIGAAWFVSLFIAD